MDLTKVLQELHQELENLNAAIHSLERLHEGSRRRERSRGLLAGLGIPDKEGVRRKAASKPREAMRK